MSISAICACKNRSHALHISLSSWLNLKEITEIIIVDWNSDEPLDYLTSLDSRIKIIRVSNKEYFNQPQPLNLAASIATGDYILKLDADYVINPYHNFIQEYFPGKDSFTCGIHNFKSPEYYDEQTQTYMIDKLSMSETELREYFHSYSPYFKYLTGLLFVSKENFKRIGGYNENLTKCYAYEDYELIDRFRLLGLKEKKLNVDYTIIHLPHQDKKRTEHFEGFGEDKEYCNMLRTNLSSVYSGEILDWQVEYALSQKHIEENKKLIGKITDYFVKPKCKWNITQINEQNYSAEEFISNNKLDSISSVYYVSLEECEDRRKELEKEFKKYNVSPKSVISKRFSESSDIITGKYAYQLNDGTKGCCVSHLKAIKKWYETTNESYGFFCEDDLSLETIKYWNFTWSDFIESIPEDADCVQLFAIRDEFDTFELRERYWNDWGATAYIMTRDYAKKIIDTYINGDTYHLEIPNYDIMPLIENILFASVGKTYTYPLFVEKIKFESTFVGHDDDVNGGHKTNHKKARDLVLNYWENLKQKYEECEEYRVEKTELEDLLTRYSVDTENPENNFALGIWYENEGHTAPALSYFLRCAERAYETNSDLAYEALIRGSYCYEKQGTRDGSARSMLWQAQAFRPDRPEAYYLLSKFAEKKEWWQDCYLNADLALRYCNFDCPPLLTDVDYPGKYGLLFEKAVSGWWWGKSEECKSIFIDLLTNYNLNDEDYKVVSNSLTKIGGEIPKKSQQLDFTYPSDFDWSSLTYEDIITIDREIVHEKVYRFWKDVKQDDVVLDIGASVGAYAVSILNQNPKKVYCVEPSKKLLNSLVKNCSNDPSLVCINYGVVNDSNEKINIFGGEDEFKGITFKEMIEMYSISHVNFMKIDCEGGEYNIFKDENMNFLKNNVDFIAMEVHLNYEGCRDKFKKFRDNYLTQFKDYKAMSCTRQNISWGYSIDIKDRLFDNEFIDNYTCEFMIYIKNR